MADDGPSMTFFAGVVGNTDEIEPEVIRVDATLQTELTSLFTEQAAVFLNDDLERVNFNPKENYRLEREQVFVIKDIRLPSAMTSAVSKPHQTSDFTLSRKPFPQITTIFAATPTTTKHARVLFQQFRGPQLLDRRFTIFATANTFHQVKQDGLSIGHELAAIYEHGNLYFRSFSIIRRFFSLEEFEPKPSPAEIRKFIDNDLFDVDAKDKLFAMIEGDGWLQRRIAAIHASGVLNLVTPRKAANKAKAFDIEIEVTRPDGTNRIRLPDTKKEVKRVVKFLNEEYFHGELSEQLYETNSLRRLQQ